MWGILLIFCGAGLSVLHSVSPSVVFKNMDVLYPALLVKAGDMNTRVRLACQDLLSVLADRYHTTPYSVCKYLVKKQQQQRLQTPWRLAKARLEALLHVVKEFGPDDVPVIDQRDRRRDVGMTIDVRFFKFYLYLLICFFLCRVFSPSSSRSSNTRTMRSVRSLCELLWSWRCSPGRRRSDPSFRMCGSSRWH